MKILLAPSESKRDGGNSQFSLESLIFKEVNRHREKLILYYQNIINRGKIEELEELFGLKKRDEIERYCIDLFNTPALKAIERYSGVAFDYIDYLNLSSSAQEYIDSNLIIFSNLFGVLKANDLIPLYKLKQGSKINNQKVEKFYNTVLKEYLDRYLEDEDILDIRAGYYDKFYKPSKEFTTLKFLKDGKVVSHWAKAYRGVVLRYAAVNQIDNIKDFIAMQIPNLSLIEIRVQGYKQELIYNIDGE